MQVYLRAESSKLYGMVDMVGNVLKTTVTAGSLLLLPHCCWLTATASLLLLPPHCCSLTAAAAGSLLLLL